MTRQQMRELGRRGGLAGGPARARALSASRRAAIARAAANARWRRPPAVADEQPRSHEQLLAFVAHHGGEPASRFSLEAVAVEAVFASRSDSALARMLPVFLWRSRRALDADALIRRARRRRVAPVLGYFLELTAALGRWRGFDEAIARLRKDARPSRAVWFFHGTGKHPFEAMLAEERTPEMARRWGLLTGTPTDSFASYFRKTSAL
jgi:hypothetical protein